MYQEQSSICILCIHILFVFPIIILGEAPRSLKAPADEAAHPAKTLLRLQKKHLPKERTYVCISLGVVIRCNSPFILSETGFFQLHQDQVTSDHHVGDYE